MNTFWIWIGSFAALLAPVTAAADEPAPTTAANSISGRNSTGSGCPYKPGAHFSAAIHVAITDRDTPSDSATIHLKGLIPASGRKVENSSEGTSRIVLALPVNRVRLEKDTLKHFSLAPRLVIENFRSPQCQLRIEPIIGNRTWALNAKTNFTLVTRVNIAGRQETFRSALYVSCFDENSSLRLASGNFVSAKQLVPGDWVWNPFSPSGIRIKEVIQGTEADEIMYRIGFDGASVWFTALHPIVTPQGLRAAKDISLGDYVLGGDGRYHSVVVRETAKGEPDHLVYNVRLDAPDSEPTSHWLSVNDIVVGDFVLQERAQADQVALDSATSRPSHYLANGDLLSGW